MTTYSQFLASKRRVVQGIGRTVSVSDVHPFLHDWQAEVVRWAVGKGRAALFEDCGLGKSVQQLEWARLSADTSLVLAPLTVARQTVREAHKVGMDVRYVRHGSEVTGPGVWITNYEMAEHFDPSMFGALVADECFAPGTLVDTPSGRTPIENVRVGTSILNASGIDVVSDAHRREVTYAVQVRVAGEVVTTSPNHPWFTQRGWIGSQDLRPGDRSLSISEAVRLVRSRVCPEDEADSGVTTAAVLRSVLLSEMADEPAGVRGEGSHSGGSGEARESQAGMVRSRVTAGLGAGRADTSAEPHERSGGASEDLPHIESDEPRSFRAWGKWDWVDRARAEDAGCTWVELAGGVCHLTGPTQAGVSLELQGRSGVGRPEARYRSGWVLPLQPESLGREEGCDARFARVDGIEVLQPGDPRLDRWRDAEGRLYFYDLGATRHPSFSVAGRLVHNSSLLKNVDGKTRQMLTKRFASVPFRLACTATPAPNDVAELTTHAEFLGLMSRAEMLAAYFVHDEDGWRLKGHGAEPMYEWMATWAVALRRPSDMGYSDEGYDLPPLRIIPEVVHAEVDSGEQLFATDLGGVGGRAAVRRSTLTVRVDRAVSLVQGREQWIVWCGLNSEADAVAANVEGSVNVEGSWTPDAKAKALEAFQDGQVRVLVSKPSICGHGMNFQNCANMAFVGLSDSWESYYQAIRRCYRFGQTRKVRAHIIVSALEQQIVNNVRRKEEEAARMTEALVRHVTVGRAA